MNATLSFEADKAINVTIQMIDKFSGTWIDDRSDDEIINDIYSQRLSKEETQPNPFNEL